LSSVSIVKIKIMKILVTGASGQLGTAVVQHLLKKTSANDIAVLVRDERKAIDFKEKGVTIHVGDYDDVLSLEKAMQGIEKVLLIAGTNEEKRLQQHQNVVDAAKKMGVSLIAYTSRCLRDKDTLVNKLMLGHFQTEDYIKESGLTYILFRNILYMDTIPNFVGQTVFDTGINLPIGEGKVSFCLRKDMGEAMANALLEDTPLSKIYKLTGSELYSFNDIALALSELSGKNVGYTTIEKPAYEQILKSKGLPDFVVQRIVGFISDIANGQENEVSTDLENFLGRAPLTLKEGLKIIYKL
jgi:NAD(P)H dehydrogenase (quinone)